MTRIPRLDPELRFWRHVNKRDPNECWQWTGGKTVHGYGRFRPGASNVPMIGAHVFSWQLANLTTVPDGHFVLHSCDNPSCVNPSHLRIGTPRDNTRDAMQKGRMKGLFNNGFNARRGRGPIKLNDDAVRAIRASKEPAKSLASLYGVDRSLVQRIRNRKAWTNVF